MSMLPPVKGAKYTFFTSLVSQADTDVFKTSVTLAAGDVKVSLDGNAFADITVLPSEIGTTGVLGVGLEAAEMEADIVVVLFHDVAGAEWQDKLVTIYTAGQTFDTIEGLVDGIESTLGVAGAGLTALGDTRLANLNATVSSRAIAGDAMALTSGERTTLAGVVWRQLTSAFTTVGSIGKWLVDRLTSGTITVVAPVLSDGEVEIVRGDVYKNEDGRRLEWSSDDWAIALTSTVLVIIHGVKALAATRLSATSVGLELTSAVSETLPEGVYTFSIQEVQVDDERITLGSSTWTTQAKPLPEDVEA